MTQPVTTLQNPNCGQETVKNTAAGSPAAQRRLPKTHKDYWKARLERRCYTHNGKLMQVNEFSIRVQHLGQRKSFALGTNNAEAAAVKARDIYLADMLDLRAHLGGRNGEPAAAVNNRARASHPRFVLPRRPTNYLADGESPLKACGHRC